MTTPSISAHGPATWVVVSPAGLAYIGLHTDEKGAWQTCLGWPDDAEIEEKKRAGWYAAQASVTWHNPNQPPKNGA